MGCEEGERGVVLAVGHGSGLVMSGVFPAFLISKDVMLMAGWWHSRSRFLPQKTIA